MVPLCRVRIIDRRWWVILALILVLFGLNWAWQTYLSAMNIWLDSIIRSLVILGGGAVIAYKAKLSPEINDQIVNSLNRK